MALFLSAALLFAGCGKTGGEQESVGDMAGGGDKTMGRYVEEEIGRPEEMERNGGIVRLADGTLQIFDFNQGPFVSQDEGKTWTKKYDDWSGMVGEGYFMNAAAARMEAFSWYTVLMMRCLLRKGEEASQEEVSDAERSEQPDTEPTETEDTEVQVEESDMFTIDCHYMFVSPEGETREIMLPFDMDNYELITNCWYTPDGRLLASQGGAIYEIKTRRMVL